MAFTSAGPIVKLTVVPERYDGSYGKTFAINVTTQHFNNMLYPIHKHELDVEGLDYIHWYATLDERINQFLHERVIAMLEPQEVFNDIETLLITNTENQEYINFRTTSLTIDQYGPQYSCDLQFYIYRMTKTDYEGFIVNHAFMHPGSFIFCGNIVLVIMTNAHTVPRYCHEIMRFDSNSFSLNNGPPRVIEMRFPRTLLWRAMIAAFSNGRSNVPFHMFRDWYRDQPMITADGTVIIIPAAPHLAIPSISVPGTNK